MKKLSGGPGEGINRKVARDDDGDGVEDRPVHVTRGGQNHLMKLIFLSLAQAEFPVNVLDHHDRAVNDDAEIDGANGEQVRSFSSKVN